MLPTELSIDREVAVTTVEEEIYFDLDKGDSLYFVDDEVAIELTRDDVVVLSEDRLKDTELKEVVIPEKDITEEEPLDWKSWQYMTLQATAGLETIIGSTAFFMGECLAC